MEVIEGHLTEGNKKAIKAIFEQQDTVTLPCGRVGKTDYYITNLQEGIYTVKIVKKDRGLGFIGEQLRISTYTHKFKL